MSAWRVPWVEETGARVTEKKKKKEARDEEANERQEGVVRGMVWGLEMTEERGVGMVSDAHSRGHCPRGGTGLILAATTVAHTLILIRDKTKRSLPHGAGLSMLSFP